MKKIFLLSLILVALFSGSLFSQPYVAIGDGTVGTSYPVSYSGYSWYSFILTKEEVAGAKKIIKISFDCTNGPKTTTNQKIYMKHTPNTVFPDANYENQESNGYVLVYSGSITYNGVTDIVLQTPFEYNGTDNLIIHYENRLVNNSLYPSFNSTTSSVNNNKSGQGDEYFPTGTGFSNPYPNSRTNVRLYYETLGPNPASNFIPDNNEFKVSLNTELKFDLEDKVKNYTVYFGTTKSLVDSEDESCRIVNNEANEGNNTITVNVLSLLSLDILLSKTDYYWKVVVTDNINTPIATATSKFTTQKIISDFPYNQNFSQNLDHQDIVFYPGYYSDWTKTDWSYTSTPITWSCWQVGEAPNYTEFHAYIAPYSLTDGESYSLTTPRFDLTGDYEVSFYWMNGSLSTKYNGYDKTYFEVSSDDGQTWEVLKTLDADVIETEFQYVSMSVTNKGNAARFRWRYEVINKSSAKSVFY